MYESIRRPVRLLLYLASCLICACGIGPRETESALTERKPTMQIPLPTAAQIAYHEREVGLFIHFMPSTWSRPDDPSVYDLERIRPDHLDTDQWVEVAESMGARYIVFVAKHGPGFRYWPTDETPFGVRQLAWRDGQGDIVGDLAESCRKRGMELGIYLTAWDSWYGAGLGGVIGPLAAIAEKLQGKPIEVTPQAQLDYVKTYRRELTEVLSGYGPVCEVWFDGGVQIPVHDIIEKHAPDAAVFGWPSDQPIAHPIRWCGNEDGWANYPLWNGHSAEKSPGYDPRGPEYVGDPLGHPYEPVEVDTTIRHGTWGWAPDEDGRLRTLDQLMEIYYNSVGRGAVLLLNIAPDDTGRMPEADAKRAAEFGDEVQRRFAKSVAETQGEGNEVVLELGKPTLLDHVVAMEDIAHGQRVMAYVIEGRVDGAWRTLIEGSTIGYKKIDRFDPVEVSAIRLRVTESLDTPIVRRLAGFCTIVR